MNWCLHKQDVICMQCTITQHKEGAALICMVQCAWSLKTCAQRSQALQATNCTTLPTGKVHNTQTHRG